MLTGICILYGRIDELVMCVRRRFLSVFIAFLQMLCYATSILIYRMFFCEFIRKRTTFSAHLTMDINYNSRLRCEIEDNYIMIYYGYPNGSVNAQSTIILQC